MSEFIHYSHQSFLSLSQTLITVHTCTHAYMHTYMYIHAYVQSTYTYIHTYTCTCSSETAQQLLQDLRSIVAWTSSPNRGLHPGTALLLTSLPFVSEMEAGLRASVSTLLSATQATDTRETDLHEVQEGVATNGSLPLPHPFPPSSSSSRQLSRERTGSGVEGGWVDKCFPVFAELAWQSLALGQQQSLHRKK